MTINKDYVNGVHEGIKVAIKEISKLQALRYDLPCETDELEYLKNELGYLVYKNWPFRNNI